MSPATGTAATAAAARSTRTEEHENHERWAVSYADMMTVLVGLFIVLFAMSKVDDQVRAAAPVAGDRLRPPAPSMLRWQRGR